MDLYDFLNDIDDISDPACYEKILIVLDNIYIEDEEFMQLLVDKLNLMVITWSQPWYQKSNCLSRPFKEMNDENNGDGYRKDSISKEESDQIATRWKSFCKMFDIPDKFISFARWRSKKKCKSPNTPEETVRRFVTAYLAQDLQRNIHQVYKHILTHFGTLAKGAYSQKEEKLMEICFHHDPKNAVANLSILLGREPRGIYKRLQQKYTGKPEKKKLKWTIKLASQFLNMLMKYTECSLEELMNKKIDKSVWLNMEKEMNHQYIYLQKFWYEALHVQIFVKKDVKLNSIRRKVLNILKESPYKVWSDIRWKEIVNLFPNGFTHIFLYKICYRLFKRSKIHRKQPLSEVIDFGLNKVNKSTRNKRLKNLTHINGTLHAIDYRLKENNKL